MSRSAELKRAKAAYDKARAAFDKACLAYVKAFLAGVKAADAYKQAKAKASSRREGNDERN
jgi:hypothetical protein